MRHIRVQFISSSAAERCWSRRQPTVKEKNVKDFKSAVLDEPLGVTDLISFALFHNK